MNTCIVKLSTFTVKKEAHESQNLFFDLQNKDCSLAKNITFPYLRSRTPS